MDQPRVALGGFDVQLVSAGGMGRFDHWVRGNHRRQFLAGLSAKSGTSLCGRDIYGLGRRSFGSYLGSTSTNVLPPAGQQLPAHTRAF